MADTVKILVVEDEAIIAAVVEDFLVEAGFEVVISYNGEAALRSLDNHPDLRGLVTDIRMPGGVSGWDVARAARTKLPTLAVVYASGDSAPDWIAQGVPGSIMLKKPFAAAQLVTGLAQLLNAQVEAAPKGA